MKIHVIVPEGGRIPSPHLLYGLGYREFGKGYSHFYIVPLNFLFQARELLLWKWLSIIRGPKSSLIDKIYLRGVSEGFKQGVRFERNFGEVFKTQFPKTGEKL